MIIIAFIVLILKHLNPKPEILAERDKIIIQRTKEGWESPKIASYIGIPLTTVKSRQQTLKIRGLLVRK